MKVMKIKHLGFLFTLLCSEVIWQMNLRELEPGPCAERACGYYIRTDNICRFGTTCKFKNLAKRKLMHTVPNISNPGNGNAANISPLPVNLMISGAPFLFCWCCCQRAAFLVLLAASITPYMLSASSLSSASISCPSTIPPSPSLSPTVRGLVYQLDRVCGVYDFLLLTADELASNKREADYPFPCFLAIWTPGETAQSIEPPTACCSTQNTGKLCDRNTCFSCYSI